VNFQENEVKFHDRWAQSESLDNIDVLAAFEAPTALENRFILQLMGDLTGKKILDVGSGLGESSVYFALKGAQVTSMDISPQMIECTKGLAKKYAVSVQTFVGSADSLDLASDQFDFVYVANLAHHVQEKASLFIGLNRVLKPNGTIFFWDPLKYNPVIEIYRQFAVNVRSPDERPLGTDDLSLMKSHFRGMQCRMFWMTTLLLFIKYLIVDRTSPNASRYWKLILRETPSTLKWWLPLKKMDDLLLQTPGLRWLAWNMVAWGHKKK